MNETLDDCISIYVKEGEGRGKWGVSRIGVGS